VRKLKQMLPKDAYVQPDVVTKVVPAPTDGWDAISPLALMDPKRAPILDNWVPRPGYVELRSGYTPYVQGITTEPVETLAVWRGPAAQKLFAASNGSIFDISNPASPTTAVSGLANNRWQYVNFTPAGAATVIQLVNGIDKLQQYNGTVWSVPVITGLPGGLDTTAIIGIASQKRRLWYVLVNSTVAAFMPTDAITGAIAGTLDLGALWDKGGFLVAIGNWTIDGGNGPQDYACFISSQGQISIYSGTDPTSATAWTLVGTFSVSPPIGRRCVLRVGSDLALITQQGVLPISQALPFDPSADRSVAITSRIQNAMAAAALSSMDNFGWELIGYPAQNLAFLNVPLTEGQQQVQFVMATLTGAWCRFTGWDANTFALYNDNLYWGDNSGDVNQAYVGGSDFTQAIAADMQCAFNYFEDPGRTKRMTMLQPLLVVNGSLTPTLSVDVDFGTSTSSAPISFLSGNTLWDQAIWDQSVWPQATQNVTDWHSVEALGHALAVRMKVSLGNSNTAVFDTAQFDESAFDTGTADPVVLQVNAFNSILEFGGMV
jgi:hypothetical protein